jgi:hypothetical protein
MPALVYTIKLFFGVCFARSFGGQCYDLNFRRFSPIFGEKKWRFCPQKQGYDPNIAQTPFFLL